MTQNRLVECSDKAAVRTLILNDPGSFNSLSENLAKQLFEQLRLAEADQAVRVVVITGAGKLFCAGGNLKDFAAVTEPLDSYISRLMAELYNPLALFIHTMKTVVVSAVNGPAIGAGVGLALNADLVLMSEQSYFSLPFIPHLAVVPDMGSSWFLARGLGYSRAMGLALTGDKLSAADALAAGLIWRCVDAESFSAQVATTAEKLASLSSGAIAATRTQLASAQANDFSTQLTLERELQTERFGSADFAEGLNAFFEKRTPDFVNMRTK